MMVSHPHKASQPQQSSLTDTMQSKTKTPPGGPCPQASLLTTQEKDAAVPWRCLIHTQHTE